MLTQRGTRLATSIGGTLTGRGADIIVIDDPLKPIDAASEPRRSAANEWFSTTLVSRLNDKEKGAIVVVTQRLHAYDLVGHILETSPDGWTVLNLPAIALADATIPIGEGRVHHRRADDVLHPERESGEALGRLRRDLGTEAFYAQYQQSPIPPGGAHFQRRWIQRYDELPERDAETTIIQSWDCAAKTGVLNDYSVCTTWLLARGRYFLMDLIRAKFDFPTLRQRAIEAAQAFRPRGVLVEDSSVGTGLIEELRRARISAIPVVPERSKEARASIEASKFESGRVLLPRRAPWLSDFEAELLAFPGGRHDDQIDSMTQALAYNVPRVMIRKIIF